MEVRRVSVENFDQWRNAARTLLLAGVSPSDVDWTAGESDPISTASGAVAPKVPARFLEIAQAVGAGEDPSRWDVLYRILYRLTHGERRLLAAMRDAIAGCQGCDLYRAATQSVFGEGPATARLVFVGEQPGDQEDLAGRPFVGPAGKLLDQALEQAGIPRSGVYITNAVKHFKFIRYERGKRRLHQTPQTIEIAACRPWLAAEIAAIRPKLIVCLGATAAHSVMGRVVRVTRERGSFSRHPWADWVTVTIHPSALLRIDEPGRRELEYEAFLNDLLRARERLDEMERNQE